MTKRKKLWLSRPLRDTHITLSRSVAADKVNHPFRCIPGFIGGFNAGALRRACGVALGPGDVREVTSITFEFAEE